MEPVRAAGLAITVLADRDTGAVCRRYFQGTKLEQSVGECYMWITGDRPACGIRDRIGSLRDGPKDPRVDPEAEPELEPTAWASGGCSDFR